MEEKNYKKTHTVLFVIQMVLIVLGYIATAYNIYANMGRLNDGDPTNNLVPFGTILVMFTVFILYAVYGYKKSPVFFNICIIAVALISSTKLSRYSSLLGAGLIDVNLAQIQMGLEICSLVCLAVYASTYKRQNHIALAFGGILIGLKLAGVVVSLMFMEEITVKAITGSSLNAELVGVGSLVIMHEVRALWRAHEKAVEAAIAE